MNGLLFLIPVALFMGGMGLIAFLWAMRRGQFEDPEGAAMRILIDDDDLPAPERPAPERKDAP